MFLAWTARRRRSGSSKGELHMSHPRWRERREAYLRESGRTADLMREGFIPGKFEVVEGGGHEGQGPESQLRPILVASAGGRLLSGQKDYP